MYVPVMRGSDDEPGANRPTESYSTTVAALSALANPIERTAYEAEVAAPPFVDDYGGQIYQREWEDRLLPRLMDKLRQGEWIASGFGYESGQPADLHSRLWHRLVINVSQNTAYDNQRSVDSRSVTGTFHSLGFRIAKEMSEVSHAARRQGISSVRKHFEELNHTLPSRATKKEFFRLAREEFGPSLVEAWLRQAWKDAHLSEERRRPGTRRSK